MRRKVVWIEPVRYVHLYNIDFISPGSLLPIFQGALAIIAAIVVFIYISYRVDVYATERLDEVCNP